jgi:hypothetical protein
MSTRASGQPANSRCALRGRRFPRCGALLTLALASMPRLSAATPADPSASEARPGPSAAAIEHYRRGVELYDAGDREAALERFERAYAISHNHQLLFNIGQIHYALQRLARARTALERYLAEGGGRVPLDRREAVQRQLAELSRKTGVLSLHLDGAPARVEIQGRSIAASAAELPLIVEPGLVHIVARRAGRAAIERRVWVAAGQVEQVSITFAAEPVADELPASAFPTRALVWAAAGVFGVAAVSTGIATRLTSNHYDELRRRPADSTPQHQRARLDRQRELVETLALTTDALAVAALAGAAVGVVLTLNEPDERPALLALGPGQVEFSVEF